MCLNNINYQEFKAINTKKRNDSELHIYMQWLRKTLQILYKREGFVYDMFKTEFTIQEAHVFYKYNEILEEQLNEAQLKINELILKAFEKAKKEHEEKINKIY
ncbi:hypothetical protein SAMN04489761_4313 [Tenacibaculum sp. MAR_2009_124]|uniref:hypothetical protein n=1 Tax=Tenacibaculum sp. MAR_2009_124 TaxID=1250059 RepID=UPI00089D58B4|nr:hypothetical protein [Tenacibaculum sp. MAR_2009_124]SED11264.1 hypothetical protein SAMN04489761_4313 [Tenacibaculum sp. MAR_2009_124]